MSLIDVSKIESGPLWRGHRTRSVNLAVSDHLALARAGDWSTSGALSDPRQEAVCFKRAGTECLRRGFACPLLLI
jgi:hypothetical protein